jgi:cytochrome P450
VRQVYPETGPSGRPRRRAAVANLGDGEIGGGVGSRLDEGESFTIGLQSAGEDVEDEELDDAEAFGILFLLVAAGGESTTSLTGTGVQILAERPDLQDRLRREPRLIAAFVEEACRIDPPFRGHYRHVVADTTLGGVAVPAGSTLVLAWTAANRDRDAFANPDDIDLDRPNPRRHVGFGWGIHLCVGAPLARVEAKVAFEQLLARTTSFSIDPSSPPLRHHLSLMVRRLVTLPLVLERRS